MVALEGRSFDVLILGAGIVGCACARECAEAGLRVGVVEPHLPGGGATAAGMGHIVVMDDSPAQLALSGYSRQLWRELMRELPAGVEYETRGTLWIAADEEEMAEVSAKQRVYAAAGIASTVLDARELAIAEPHLRKGLAGALLVQEDAVIYPPVAAAYFLERAERAGATLLRGAKAVRIGEGVVELANGTRLTAATIVVATGADTELLPRLPIQRRKGHLLITDRYPGFVNHQLVELGYLKSAHRVTADSVAFNVQPRQTGQLLIGSSRQYGDEGVGIHQGILKQMLERACSYLPGLAAVSGIRVWTGFRAATPDKLPLIGPTEDRSVLLCMGFEGLGITNATGAARLLLSHIAQKPCVVDPIPFLPSRMQQREAVHA